MAKNLGAAAVIGTIAAAVALSGCSSSNNGTPSTHTSTAGSTTNSSSSSAPAAGRATEAGPTLLDEVTAAMKAASGFHVTADVTTGGQEEKLDIHYGATTASGTVTMGGNAIQLISVAPYVYLKASQDFWKTFVPSASQAQFLPLIEGKWVKAKASSSDFADLASVLDKNSFIDNLGNGDPSAKFVNLGLSHVGSTQVVRLRNSADGTVVDILASGTPYPVDALPGKTAGTGGATFSDWNVPYTATAPPASETFDVSALLGG